MNTNNKPLHFLAVASYLYDKKLKLFLLNKVSHNSKQFGCYDIKYDHLSRKLNKEDEIQISSVRVMKIFWNYIY